MPLPRLREELALYPGPRLHDGQPSWTLHDPTRNQFFRIDWPTFEILHRWSLDDATRIAHEVRAQTTLDPDADDVEAVAQFLFDNQLVQIDAPGSAAHLAQRLRVLRGTAGRWLLHHYLFFRIPLLHPDRWLARMAPRVAFFYSPTFLRVTLAALALGLVLVYRDWDRFSATLIDVFTWRGLLGYALALTGVKVLHELGHAFTAKRYGCRVPAMGVAFLVMWPVAYTDTNDVWKLADRRQRLAVAAAGVATELLVAVWALLAWALLPEGAPKSIAFMLATTTWMMTVAINSSPFMRFDGYFLLSDWLDMPNLHARAFALARWDLRERLFDLGEPPPEYFAPRRQRALILFAYGTWLYRLLLFLGIAVLVYHFFIKAVGILLFIVEIGWFVLLPLIHEVKAWRERWPALRASARARRSAVIGGVVLALTVIPWPARVSGSAYLHPTRTFTVYAPEGAQVTAIRAQEGASVKAGEIMLQLASPDLLRRWQATTAHVDTLQRQVAAAGVDATQRRNLQVVQQELATAQAELAAVQADLDKYAPRAPFDGRVRDLDPELAPGVWVGRGERLAAVVQPGAWSAETYLDEETVRRVRVGDHARFYPDGHEGPFLTLTVAAIDRDATRVLPNAMLAAPFGGSVIVRDKQGQLIPERAVFRVTLTAPEGAAGLADQTWRGVVTIHARWEAPGLRFLRSALAVAWREGGF